MAGGDLWPGQALFHNAPEPQILASVVGQEKLLSNKVYVFESWTEDHCLIIVKYERSSSFFLGMK